MDDSKKQLLKAIFWAMNEISSHSESKTETVIEESDDGHGNIVQTESTVTRTYLYITVSHKTAEEMADKYGFNAETSAKCLRSCLLMKIIPCGVPSFTALVWASSPLRSHR